ncbi:glycosyltransferase family 2 protein [Burkholderia multivorans]|uniref:Glycosyltransferase family 2 protein n=1 Tax=Burkholderia multivorans TaxID=87883 RepID=A0AB37AYM2_9BURK|nr:glycosyltransferase family 2 protein [Burkholderia multivorans]PRE53539.1 hypothetical protein C6P97_05645 [Burkholderia multivorans]PRE53798.1 hypothetical protein C6P99_05885 [Burkholderia multivorans]
MIDKIGVASIFKNEYPFIVEWLAYHRSLGVKRFFVADNESDDGTRELLICLRNLGYIELEFQPVVEGENSQLAAYKMLLEKYGGETDWLAFVDADEFLVLERDDISIEDYLREISEIKDVGAVAVNWAVYGSSHWVTAGPGFVTDRFILRAEQSRSVNRHYKTLLNTSACRGVGTNPHSFKIGKDKIYVNSLGQRLTDDELGGLTKDPVWGGIRINHYVVKSRGEFFTKKRPRGRPGGKTRAAEFFSQHDVNDVEDRLSDVRAVALQKEYKKIVAALHDAGFEYSEQVDKNALFYSTGSGGLKFRVDGVSFENERIDCKGWVAAPKNNCVDFNLLVNYTVVVRAVSVERMTRIDVARHLKGDPDARYGFKCVFDVKKAIEEAGPIDLVELCIGAGDNNVGVITRLVI